MVVEDEISDCIGALDGVGVGGVGGEEPGVVGCDEGFGGGVGPELSPNPKSARVAEVGGLEEGEETNHVCVIFMKIQQLLLLFFPFPRQTCVRVCLMYDFRDQLRRCIGSIVCFGRGYNLQWEDGVAMAIFEEEAKEEPGSVEEDADDEDDTEDEDDETATRCATRSYHVEDEEKDTVEVLSREVVEEGRGQGSNIRSCAVSRRKHSIRNASIEGPFY